MNADSLFAVDAVRRAAGRPKRQTIESLAPASDVRLANLVEVARRVEGPHEVLGHLFDNLRLDRVLDGRGTAMLRDLVFARCRRQQQSPPQALGSPDVRWSGKRLAQRLSNAYGVTVSVRSCQRLIAQVRQRAG